MGVAGMKCTGTMWKMIERVILSDCNISHAHVESGTLVGFLVSMPWLPLCMAGQTHLSIFFLVQQGDIFEGIPTYDESCKRKNFLA